jgi:hypothetical protein
MALTGNTVRHNKIDCGGFKGGIGVMIRGMTLAGLRP